MKPFPDHQVPSPARDPFAAQGDRTPEEIAAIRALSGALEALLDAPRPSPLPPVEDDELAITREALPTIDDVAEPEPASAALESGLADRMRGVLRGVLVRARRNRSPR